MTDVRVTVRNDSDQRRLAMTAAAVFAVACVMLAIAAADALAKPGASGTMRINGGAEATSSLDVTLNSRMSNATQMQFRDAGGAWSGWEPYSATRAWTLPAGDGVKTVEAQYKAGTGKKTSRSDTIVLDTAAPTLTGLTSPSHPEEATWYGSVEAAFEWTAEADLSGVAGYSIVLDQTPDTTPDAVVDTGATSTTEGTAGDGVWAFHVRPVDKAGNWGSPLHRVVLIDASAPTTCVESTEVTGRTVTLTLAASDGASGVVATEYRVAGEEWATGTTVVLTRWTRHKKPGLRPGDHTLEYRSVDSAGNVEETRVCVVTVP